LFLLTKVQYPVKFKIQPLDKEEQYYIIAIDMKGDNSQESDDTIHKAIAFIMFGTRRYHRVIRIKKSLKMPKAKG
jgi:uncharacterized protein (UPF0248 family)